MAKRLYDDMIRHPDVLRHTLSSRHVERDGVGAEKVGGEEQVGPYSQSRHTNRNRVPRIL
jgi:hypothetical protein